MAAATGKPIDLFFSTVEEDFNLAGYFDGETWTFRMAFCGRDFFFGATKLPAKELVDAIRPASGR